MTGGPILILARRELTREWTRSITSTLSIALGVALLIAADFLSTAVTSEIQKSPEAQAITGFISEQLNVGLTAVSLVITVGAGFIVFNTLSMAITQRLADLGRLRAIGMTTKQAVRAILLEAFILGCSGVLIGIPGGILFSSGVMRLLEATSAMFNQFGDPEVPLVRILLAAILGVAVVLVAAIAPARRTSRISPLAMLRRELPERDGEPNPPRTLSLTILMIGMLAYLVLFPPALWIQPPWDSRLVISILILWLGSFILALPGWIGAIMRCLQGATVRIFGPVGLLGMRNSLRARHRVTYTTLTLAIGVAMIVGARGFLAYWFDELFSRTMAATLRDDGTMGIVPLDVSAGMQAYTEVESFSMPQEMIPELDKVVAGRAVLAQVYFILIPDLSFMGEDYFSFVLHPQDLRSTKDLFFQFSNGNWDEAQPLLENGCGILTTPIVAQQNGVGLYDSLTLQTMQGQVDCVVAGIGSPMVGASIVSDTILEEFGLSSPVILVLLPHLETDRGILYKDIEEVLSKYEGVLLIELSKIKEMQWEAMESVKSLMNGMLVLAILGAALSVVSVLRMSFQERQVEFALLHAIGATQRQIKGMILVEAGLFGVLGGLSGLILGFGLVLIYTLTVGGGFMGFLDFPVREAALTTLRTVASNGFSALLLSPLVTTLVAWFTTQGLLKERTSPSTKVGGVIGFRQK